jgi:hypothetical protein
MNYKIVILLVLTVFLGFLIDRVLVKYTPLPCNNNVSSPADSTCAENNNDDKDKNNANIAYKTFSSPKADFTFEYPDTWVYDEKTDLYNPNATSWIFYTSEKEKFEMPILAAISPLTEVVDFCSIGYKGAKTSYQLNTFPTNDPETFITYEQCGGEYGGAYIYWQKGEYFANASLINDIHKINLMNFYSGSKEGVEIARHIAQSIKIK